MQTPTDLGLVQHAAAREPKCLGKAAAKMCLPQRQNTGRTAACGCGIDAPCVEIMPTEGLTPTRPCKPAGTRPLPAVSVPTAKLTAPAATALADPEDEPPAAAHAWKQCAIAAFREKLKGAE